VLQHSTVRNRLLRRLSGDDFALLQPHLRPMPTKLRQILISPREPVTQLFFPEVGYVSVLAENGKYGIEVGMVGREGLVGAAPVLLGSDCATYHEFVQSAGEMLAIGIGPFCTAVRHSPTLRRLMLRYVQTKLIQTSQTACANAVYNMDLRLARWLLMCHDRLDGDEIPITHDLIALLLGVQRSGVTVAVRSLAGARLIRRQRGRITVLNREALITLAHSSYGVPEAEYARLIEET